MDTGVFIALLNPAIALTLASAFLILWFHQQKNRYLIGLAAGYTSTAFGFLLQFFVLPIGLELTKCVSAIFFIMAGCLLAGSIIARYSGSTAARPLAILAVAGIAAFCWFMFASPNLMWRILSINLAIGGMSLVVARELWPMRRKGAVERLLLVLSLLVAVNMIVRPVIVLNLGDAPISYQVLYQSLYWTTALLTHALTSLLVALCLFTAAALDVVVALRSDSETDQLSGLLNRRGFENRVAAVWSGPAKAGHMAMIIADLDHFKSINDRYGHDVGDKVIVDFARLLRSATMPGWVVGRLGGEEFAVLITLTSAAGARLFAEGVRAAFESGGVATASFGVAVSEAGDDKRRLMQRADRALYRAKTDGRNQVATCTESAREATSVAVPIGVEPQQRRESGGAFPRDLGKSRRSALRA